MFKNIYQFKGNFKGFLFILAVILVLGFLYYTQTLVGELQKQSRAFLNFRIKIFEESINSEEEQDLSFFFNEVIQQADYPIIYTDAEGEPIFWRNIDLPDTLRRPLSPDTLALLKKYVKNFDKINEPIPISFQGKIFGYYHYGESHIIQRLRWLPYIEILVVALFILIGYMGFSSIKKSEERFIWVGMAKETAHQLGTPLSSLIGWIEYLKTSPEKLPQVMPDIERDVKRLQKVTNRFSQIGSLPDLREEKLQNIIDELLTYFKHRLPSNEGKIKLSAEVNPRIPPILLNRDLFSWVLENLIKNAMDALEGNGGSISIQSDFLNEKQIYIDVRDTGKGISSRHRKDIFNPGYSTKKRGWGLGLSLSRRIVEEYHGGRLELKESAPGAGSVFRIVLNIKKG